MALTDSINLTLDSTDRKKTIDNKSNSIREPPAPTRENANTTHDQQIQTVYHPNPGELNPIPKPKKIREQTPLKRIRKTT